MFSVPLSVEEKMLAEALGFNLLQLESEIQDLITLGTTDSDNTSISRDDLHLASMNLTTVKPGFSLLKDSEKSRYDEILAGAVKRMLCKSKKDLSKNEVASYLTRFFLDHVENKGEFDFLLADKNSSTFLQLEVKSYPQDGVPDNEGLRKPLEKANEQLGKGDKFFYNVLAPAAQLSSSWNKLNFVCFPKISNRQQFRDLGLDDIALKFILTAEELQSKKWFEDLSLPYCEAAEEEYKRLLAVCVGSQHLAFNCQMFDHWEEHQNTQAQLVGEARLGEVAGIGGEEGPEHGASTIDFLDLKAKPLGHTWNILFWTQDQLCLLESLKNGENIVLCGDYGTGKTSLLIFAALEAAKDLDTKVFFITAIHERENGNVLDEAMRMKFEGTTVEVLTLKDLRELHRGLADNMRFNGNDTHILIREFIKTKTQPVKVFIDEFHMSEVDLRSLTKREDTAMAETMTILEKHSLQTWVALSTLSLLDKSEIQMGRNINSKIQRNNLIKNATRKTSFRLVQLKLRMRNSSSIGASVPEDVSKVKKGSNHVQTRVIREASSAHTVVGLRPSLIIRPDDMGTYPVLHRDYTLVLTESLQQVLKLEANPTEYAVVLCGKMIPVPEVSEAITKLGYSPITLPQKPTDEERQKLRTWLRTGGLLVTSSLQFVGMEASTCVFITENIVEETGVRSALLRATARLVVVSFTRGIDREEVLKRFLVNETPEAKVEWKTITEEERLRKLNGIATIPKKSSSP